ncbi:hypothetical protein HDU87_004661 [Geranomyces variabilis]|uniref:Uncharacterized protein n=1 Tax=Geranomyces variabilis TaxID=109894 RepID=A0AAD5XPT7_9FUNG|nr:hypothetical protein HDU87_004661 [Geranomyces variabilis]
MPSAPSRSPSSPLSRLFHINGAVAAANSFLFHTQDDELPWPTAELLRSVHTPPYASRQGNNDGEDQDGDDDDDEDDDEDDPSYEDFDEPLAELAARADMTLVNSAGLAARSHRGFAGPADGSAAANDGVAHITTTTTTTTTTTGGNGGGGGSAAITSPTEADAEDAVRFLLSNPGPPFLRPHIDRDFVRRLRHIATRAQGEDDGDGEEDPVRLDHGFVDFGVEDDEDSDEESEASDEEDEDDADADEDDDDDDEDKTEADLADLEAQFLSRGQSLHGRRRRRSSSASSTESTSRSWLIDASLLDLVTQIHAPMNAGTSSSSVSTHPRRLLRRPAYRHYSPHSNLGLGGPPRHGAMGLPPRWPPLGTSGRRQWRDRVRDLRSSSGGGGDPLNSNNNNSSAGGPSSLSWLSLSPLSSTPPPSASDPSAIVCAVISDVEKLFSERMDENGDFRCDASGASGGGGGPVELGRAWEVLGRLGRVDVDRDGQCGAHRRRMRKRRRDEGGARIRERVWHVGDAGR